MQDQIRNIKLQIAYLDKFNAGFPTTEFPCNIRPGCPIGRCGVIGLFVMLVLDGGNFFTDVLGLPVNLSFVGSTEFDFLCMGAAGVDDGDTWGGDFSIGKLS